MNTARVLRGLVLGAAGGFLGWVLVELIVPGLARALLHSFSGTPAGPFQAFLLTLAEMTDDTQRAASLSTVAAFGAIIGLMDGLALGVSEGITAGTRSKFERAVGMGAVTGLLGGLLGLAVGQMFYSRLRMAAGVTDQLQPGFFPFLVDLLARSVGWGLIGTFVGSAVGFPSGSTQKIRNGLIGGTIGGLIGGFAFEIVAVVTAAGGTVPRLIGLTSIGAAVGLFVSLVDEVLKTAWVKILVGRNEGREVVIDKPIATVGRDELADIPVFGDPSVSRHHATIYRQDSHYLIQDQGAPAGTQVNGQPVSRHYLQDGDEIQLGGVRMIFYEKAGLAPARRPVDVARPAVAPAPAGSANICAFCGGVKDPLTGACACAVAEPSGSAAAASFSWSAGSSSAAAAPGAARLLAAAGPYAGQAFAIPAGGGSIGRDPAREISLAADATVSRRHASLVPQAGGFLLRDEGSSNGTFVNNQRVQEHLLRPGDEIRIGASLFRFAA